jgi:hypothetical protein
VRRSPRLLFIAVAAWSALEAPRAHAAAPDEAESLVNQAVELRRNGDDQGALGLLLQAYERGHTPRTTGQLGLCEQALGRWVDAELYLTDALKAEGDPWVKKNRRALEDAITIVKSHIARVEIQGEPDGAEVWVSGALVGTLPLQSPLRVAAGEVEIELRAPGYVGEAKTMHLDAGQYQRIVLRARKEAAPPAPTPPPEAAPSVASTPTIIANADRPPQPAEAPPPRASAWRLDAKWVAWGLGAAGVGLGVYGAIANARGVSSFNTKCSIRAGQAVLSTTGETDPTCVNEKSDYETKGTLGITGFVTGGALATLGLVLWLTEPTARAHETAGLTCVPAVLERGALAVGCRARF